MTFHTAAAAVGYTDPWQTRPFWPRFGDYTCKTVEFIAKVLEIAARIVQKYSRRVAVCWWWGNSSTSPNRLGDYFVQTS